MIKNKRKKFIIDTSVFLYDANCIKNFSGNDLIIPLIVLEEIDKFKSKEGILGENAREVNRFLDDLRSKGSLNDGVFIEDFDLNILVSNKYDFNNLNLDKENNDNIIIACANWYRNNLENFIIKIITKDINLRVKSDAVGISADDYFADYINIKSQEKGFYQGFTEIVTDTDFINNLYKNHSISIDKLNHEKEILQNEFITFKTELGQSALAVRKNNNILLIQNKSETFKTGIIYHSTETITPKNKEQTFALFLLKDESIPLVTLTGVPGSGKTFLTLMSALNEIENKRKSRIIFTRPIQTVGKDIGFLPGTLNEKMAPWLAPIVDNFRNQFGDLSYFDLMMEKGIIDVAPLSYIRGRSFNDSIIIVDEAQNATVHELKTVITRTGKNSKIILLGDIEQIDLPYVNKYSNGLTIIIEKLKDTNLTGHINFTKGYRSELANLVAEKLI